MTDQQPQDLSGLITYPAEMSIKAMGLNADKFESWVIGLITPFIDPEKPNKIETRESSGGKYLSVTVHFTASSQKQYELVYNALRDDTRVLFTL